MSRPSPAIGIGVGAALVTGATLGNLGANLMPVLLPGVTGGFHVSNTAAGVVATLQLLATALATLAVAPRTDRPGRTQVATIGLIVTVAGFSLAFAASDLMMLAVGNVIAGAGLGVGYAAAMAAITATDDTDRASAIAVVGATIVIAVLVVVVPEANAAWGGAAGFAVLAVCCLPALWLVRALPDATGPGPGRERERGTPVSVVFLVAVAVLGATDQGAWSFSAVLGEHQAGMSEGAVSLVLAIASVASLAGVALSAVAARKAGRLPTIAVLVGLEAVAKLAIATVPSGTSYLIAAVIWQICFMGLLVQVLAVAAAADGSGRWVAAASGALAIGTGLGPAPAGWVLETFGAPTFGLTLAVITAAVAVPLLRTLRPVCG